MNPTLRQMQSTFWSHMVDGAKASPARGMFQSENGFNATDRMAVHADMYIARLLEALRADFSIVHMWLGDDLFDTLAFAYLRENPPRHFSIGHAGAWFAEFLHQAGLHAAADLATLCWCRMEVFSAADMPAIGIAALGAHPEPDMARLSFVPSMQLIQVDHDVTYTWRNISASSIAGGAFDSGPQTPATVAVWRTDEDVLHTRLSEVEARALHMARQGATLAAVCETFAALPDAEAEAMRAISAWFADGWVAALT